ncbi:MAG: DUF4167 domain-containing protein [Rhodospirillaceae bacterium]|nr:DUF4167 domain-containing protein [Rhodospirillaceae bacterium]MCY4309858.1 DUF4167 domain-containing protein [Rhodospirillaceae bacterium]
MRQNNNQRRGRGRNNQNRRPGRNQSFDSNGPSVRLRGTAAQLHDRYQALARDATSAGDRVVAENYHQHADHYYRVMIALNPPTERNDERQPGVSEDGDAQTSEHRNRVDRRDNRNRHSRDRQEDSTEQPAEAANSGEASAGAESESKIRDRRQTVRRQDSDPRRRNTNKHGEARPGDEPLDKGLHRMLGSNGDGAADGETTNGAAPPEMTESASTDTEAEKDVSKPRRAQRKTAGDSAEAE